MKRLITLLVIATVLSVMAPLAQANQYTDTLLIFWNVLDTLTGQSIPADSAPRIRIYMPVAGVPTLVRNALMTQDTAGVYYYAFACPDTTATFGYKVRYTVQGKAYVFAKGIVPVNNLEAQVLALDTMLVDFTDTSAWLTATEWDSMNYMTVLQAGNEERIGILQNPSFEGDSIAGATTPPGWQKIECPDCAISYNSVHGSRRASIYPYRATGKWLYRIDLAQNDSVIYFQRIYLYPGIYALKGWIDVSSTGSASLKFFIDSGSTPSWSNYKDSILITSGTAGGFKQYSKMIVIKTASTYSVGVLYKCATGTSFSELDGIDLLPVGPLLVTPTDTTGSGEILAVLSDSSSYQGAAGSLTAQQVWEYPTRTVLNMPDSLMVRRWVWRADSALYGNYGRNVDNVSNVNIDSLVVYGANRQAILDLDSFLASWPWDDNLIPSRRRLVNTPFFTTNWIVHGSFDEDSVWGATPPPGWSLQGTNLDSCLTLSYTTAESDGKYYYRLKSAEATPFDTLVVYQNVGWLQPGIYTMTARIQAVGVAGLALFVDDADADYKSGYLDSASFTPILDWRRFAKNVSIATAGYYIVGARIRTNSAGDYGYFEDFRFEYRAPDTSQIKQMALNNPSLFLDGGGGSGTCLSGPVTVVYYVIDSTGATLAESLLVDADIGAYAITGSGWARATTSTSGFGGFTANVGDSLVVTAQKIGWTFPKADTIVIPDTFQVIDTIWGYNTLEASKCRVWFYAADIGSDPLIRYSRLIVTLQSGQAAVMDTCNNRVVPVLEKWWDAADTTGKFEVDLLKNTCLSPGNLQYKGEIRIGTKIVADLGLFTVPDSASYRLIVSQ